MYVYFLGIEEKDGGGGELKLLKRKVKKVRRNTGVYSVQYQKKVVLELTAYNSAGPTNVENRPEHTVNGGGSDLRWENGNSEI